MPKFCQIPIYTRLRASTLFVCRKVVCFLILKVFQASAMPISLSDIVTALPSDETWGPPTITDSLVDGVPYAPYSKGDKLGRMADWTTEGKDRDGRGGRQQYNRSYRGAEAAL